MSYIAIDLGGTNVRVAACEDLNKVEFSAIEKNELAHDFEKDFTWIIETAKRLSNGNVDAVGFGVPGTLNAEKDTLVLAPNLPEWLEVNIKEKAEKELDCSVCCENDAVAAALGEAVYGEAQHEDFLYITWGTGIGGAVITNADGRIDVQKIYWEKYLKDWEQVCGGKKIEEQYNISLNQLPSDKWDLVMDECYKQIIFLVNEFKIHRIIMEGGLAMKQQERVDKLAQKLKEKNILLTLSGFGVNLGLYGAVALIVQQGC